MQVNLTGNVIIRHQSVPECKWCDKAKEYLEEKGLKYTVINSDKIYVINSGKVVAEGKHYELLNNSAIYKNH